MPQGEGCGKPRQRSLRWRAHRCKSGNRRCRRSGGGAGAVEGYEGTVGWAEGRAHGAVAVQAAWDGACLRVGVRARPAVFVGVATRVGAAEQVAQLKQAVTHTEGGWREHLDRGRHRRAGDRRVPGGGLMRGKHIQERARRGRSARMAGTGSGDAVVQRESGARGPLGEQTDSSRRRGLRVVTCVTGRRTGGHGRGWSQADVLAGSGSG